jgi:hypothetical protein
MPRSNQRLADSHTRESIRRGLLIVATIVLGLASRKFRTYLPPLLAAYAGDTLWALVVYLGVGLLLPRRRLGQQAVIASAFCLFIESSQLWQPHWLNALRRTTLGGLSLGYGFLWGDLICYAVGILTGISLDIALIRGAKTQRQALPGCPTD